MWDEHMLPAIYFVFSRVGCAAAVDQCLAAGLRLTSSDEREAIPIGDACSGEEQWVALSISNDDEPVAA